MWKAGNLNYIIPFIEIYCYCVWKYFKLILCNRDTLVAESCSQFYISYRKEYHVIIGLLWMTSLSYENCITLIPHSGNNFFDVTRLVNSELDLKSKIPSSIPSLGKIFVFPNTIISFKSLLQLSSSLGLQIKIKVFTQTQDCQWMPKQNQLISQGASLPKTKRVCSNWGSNFVFCGTVVGFGSQR